MSGDGRRHGRENVAHARSSYRDRRTVLTNSALLVTDFGADLQTLIDDMCSQTASRLSVSPRHQIGTSLRIFTLAPGQRGRCATARCHVNPYVRATRPADVSPIPTTSPRGALSVAGFCITRCAGRARAEVVRDSTGRETDRFNKATGWFARYAATQYDHQRLPHRRPAQTTSCSSPPAIRERELGRTGTDPDARCHVRSVWPTRAHADRRGGGATATGKSSPGSRARRAAGRRSSTQTRCSRVSRHAGRRDGQAAGGGASRGIRHHPTLDVLTCAMRRVSRSHQRIRG